VKIKTLETLMNYGLSSMVVVNLGKTFAPCFKQITNKNGMIVGFNKPSYYKGYFLKPSRQVKKNIIIDEWEDIKKIVVSLALKKSNQSVLVRKLCGTARKNNTKEALWEYDAVIRSNYILKYIGDEQLRKSVRTALNRTEAYHQIKRMISTINSDSVLGQSDDDVMLNDQCTRLLSLMVIYYNGYMLSEIIKIKKAEGKTEELKYYKHISLVAWLHINFHGFYNFKRQLTHESLQKIIKDAAALSLTISD
jgi:TnpA family transposase